MLYEPLNLKIAVRRSKRIKRITMRFTPPDKLSLSCPIGISNNLIEEFVFRNENWLIDKKSRIESKVNVGVGVKIPFKGKLFLICRGDQLSKTCKIDDEKLLVVNDGKEVGLQVRNFLIKEIKETATPLALRFSQILGENFKSLKFKDTKSRWGSCTSDKALMLSWRLIMAPEDVLEYVVAHEVAHLRHMDHGVKFWETVKILCQDYKLLRKWVRSEGVTLFNYNFNGT